MELLRTIGLALAFINPITTTREGNHLASHSETNLGKGLLSIPPELRLMIYDLIPSEHFRGEAFVYLNRITKLHRPDLRHLYALNQVSRQIYIETKERLYYGLFTITVGCPEGRSSIHVLNDDTWRILLRLRRVHLTLWVNICDSHVKIEAVASSAKRIVGLLSQSKELRQFSFILSMEGSDFESKKYALRRATTKEGREAGRNAVERELDYASKAIEVMQGESLRRRMA